METQRHGFDWEIEIKRKVFGITEQQEADFKLHYTSKWDIPKELHDGGGNISIKTSGSDTVCMGDAIRIFNQNPDETNTCIVVFYKQEGNEKVINRIVEWKLDKKLLFEDVTLDELQELQQAIVNFPKHTRLCNDQEYKQKLTDMASALNAKSGALKFNRKIDSKTQRRLQCSISGFDAFITKNSHLVVYDTPLPILRDVRITERIVSSPRTFDE